MAEKPVTLADIRAAVKHPDNQGVLLGDWSADSGQSLIAPLQEMGDDIIKWLNPAQGWKLVEVRTGFMNLKRIEQSSVDPSNPQAKPAIFAKKVEPDQFVPCFHLDADNPPVRKGLLRGKWVDFPSVFNPECRDKVAIWPWTSDTLRYATGADVYPDKIGAVYPLEKAVKELSSPYYLVGVIVTLNRRAEQMSIGQADKKRAFEPPTSLAVTVFMRDLPDHLRLEELKIRRARRRLDKVLSGSVLPQIPTQESKDQPIKEVYEEAIKELEQFGEKLTPYYDRYMNYVATSESIDPNSPDHPVRMVETGVRCRAIRKQCSLSREEVADQLGVEYVQLAAFEGGLIPSADLPEGFTQKLSDILTKSLEAQSNSEHPLS